MDLEDDTAKAMLELCNHSLVLCKVLSELGLLHVEDIVGDPLQLASSSGVLGVHLLDVCRQGFPLQTSTAPRCIMDMECHVKDNGPEVRKHVFQAFDNSSGSVGVISLVGESLAQPAQHAERGHR